MILIYAGIVPSKSAGKKSAQLEELQVRSKLLLHQLARQQAPIFLPTIAVSELLVPVPATHRGALIATLTERLVCPPFDLHAAAIAAELWVQHKNLPADLRYDDRQVLKADAMIVASAKAAGATAFYTHDKKCRALARLAVMSDRDLPTHDPDDMFILEAIRRGEA